MVILCTLVKHIVYYTSTWVYASNSSPCLVGGQIVPLFGFTSLDPIFCLQCVSACVKCRPLKGLFISFDHG